jgi:hypothetical protein
MSFDELLRVRECKLHTWVWEASVKCWLCMPSIVDGSWKVIGWTERSITDNQVDPERGQRKPACHDSGLSCLMLRTLFFLKSGMPTFEAMSEGAEAEHTRMKSHVFLSKKIDRRTIGYGALCCFWSIPATKIWRHRRCTCTASGLPHTSVMRSCSRCCFLISM